MANPECGDYVIRNLMPHSHILRAALNPSDPSAPLLLILAVLEPSAEPHVSSGPDHSGSSQGVADDIYGLEHSNLHSGELSHVPWDSAPRTQPLLERNLLLMSRCNATLLLSFESSPSPLFQPGRHSAESVSGGMS